MPPSHRVSRFFWAAGLTLVLAMLGHDVLMSSVANAAPTEQEQAAVHVHGAVDRASGDDAAHAEHDPVSGHPRDCGTTQAAVPSTSNQHAADPTKAIGVITIDDHSSSTLVPADGWHELSCPPGTRRALLQVYRM